MDEAFSFEKLFFRSDRKMTNLGGNGGWNQKKFWELFYSWEVWILPSPLKVSAYPELSCTSRTFLPWYPIHYGFCYLFPPRTIVLPWAAHEGREPHHQTSWAWKSAGGKLFVCSGKMPTPKSLCNLLLWPAVSVAAGRTRLLANREQFFTPKNDWVQLFRNKALIIYLSHQACGSKCLQEHLELPGLITSAIRISCPGGWLDHFTLQWWFCRKRTVLKMISHLE